MTPIALLTTLIITATSITDGDTFRSGNDRYRLFGIDAPERGDADARPATAALDRLITGRALTCDWVDTDRYQRRVVRCDLPDGRDLSCAMVAGGWAVDWPRYSKGKYAGCEE